MGDDFNLIVDGLERLTAIGLSPAWILLLAVVYRSSTLLHSVLVNMLESINRLDGRIATIIEFDVKRGNQK